MFSFNYVTNSNTKDTSSTQKLSKGGIPLANGDALLPKPPPWAYPLWTGPDMYRSGYDRMSRSTSEAIDQAMAQLWESKMKFVRVSLSVEKQLLDQSKTIEVADSNCGIHCHSLPRSSVPSEDFVTSCQCGEDGNALEWVRVILTADPGVRMDDVEDQEPPRRKEHRRVPSTVLFEEVKVGL